MTIHPHIIIVGAGLGGCVLAARLQNHFRITMVDLAAQCGPLTIPVHDVGHPARIKPHAGSGPGGTTHYWQNGLIEIAEEDFAAWPFSKRELDPYYSLAFYLLSDQSREIVSKEFSTLKKLYAQRGIPESVIGESLYYPLSRRNLWKSLGLSKQNIAYQTGRALRFNADDSGQVRSLTVQTANSVVELSAECFVSCAGGLSSPVLLQNTAANCGLRLPAAGRFYHDHPSAFVAQVTLGTYLHDLWNYSSPELNGNIRTGFVVREAGCKFAFYLRPVFMLWPHGKREKLRSLLIDLRNNPYSIPNYWKLLKNGDDLIDILSFRLGLRIPTRVYSVLMVAEESSEYDLGIGLGKNGSILRNWRITPDYKNLAETALQRLLDTLGPIVKEHKIFRDWAGEIMSSAHHSGTCRMGTDAATAVCDSDNKVFGLKNLFVCDGSALPSSGYANTGLTIAALALRLADHLRARA